MAFKAVADGENVPAPPDQMPVVTPVTDPARVTEGVCPQAILSVPALAVMGLANWVTVTLVLPKGHPVASVTITEYVPGPTKMDGVVAPVLHVYE